MPTIRDQTIFDFHTIGLEWTFVLRVRSYSLIACRPSAFRKVQLSVGPDERWTNNKGGPLAVSVMAARAAENGPVPAQTTTSV
jgi:hypothetical protein